MQAQNVEDIVILSPMQRLMLFHELAGSGTETLHNQFRFAVQGEMDRDRVAACWQQLTTRHAALRACFLWEGLRDPVQVIREHVTLPFAFHDLQELSLAAQQPAMEQLLETDRNTVFDLRRAPLLRLTLIQLGPQNWELAITRHHLIMDRWCFDQLFQEWFHLHRTTGEPAGLQTSRQATPSAHRAGQFTDYLAWIASRNTNEARAFWSSYLDGFEQPTTLYEGLSSHTGVSTTRKSADSDLSTRVRAAARDNGIGQATLLQAALGVVIAKRRQSHDVVFGLTVSGRPADLENVETIVGSLINTVPVRITHTDPEESIAAWLHNLQQIHARRAPYEYMALPDIQAASPVPASEALFDVLLVLNTPVEETVAGPGFELTQIAAPQDSRFPMNILVEQRDTIQLVAVHHDAIVDAASAGALLAEVLAALEQICAARTVGELFPHAPAVRTTARTSTASTPPNPADSAEVQLQHLFAHTLGVDEVGLDDDFFALGGTSVQAAALFAAIERSFGSQLSLATLFESGSVRALLSEVSDPRPRSSPLVQIQPRGERPALFVVPGIGGNVVGLNDLARACGQDQPFFGLQSPGLDGQSQALQSIEEIAATFVKSMPESAHQIVLCGICFGAVVAFEMAQQLAALGRAPARLVLFDPVLDETVDQDAPPTAQTRAHPPEPKGFVHSRLQLYRDELKPLTGAQRLSWVWRKVLSLTRGATDSAARAETRLEYQQQRVIALNIDAHKRYRPRAYPGESVVLLTADRALEGPADPRLGWFKYLSPNTPKWELPGATTGEAISGPNARFLAQRLRTLTDELNRDHQDLPTAG